MRLLVIFISCLIVLSGCGQPSKHILVQNQYVPKPGKENEVYILRLHASDVLAKLGLQKGRVLKRPQLSDRPYVMWECEYSSMNEREMDVAKVSKSEEFKKIEDHMGTLVDSFERVTWEVED